MHPLEAAGLLPRLGATGWLTAGIFSVGAPKPGPPALFGQADPLNPASYTVSTLDHS